MRGFFTLASAAIAVALWMVGCNSDNDSVATSRGGSAGSAGGGSDAKCGGVYADLSLSVFESKLSSSGSCIGPSDAPTICAIDVTKIAEECGGSCFKTAASDSAAQDTCNTNCLNSMITPTPSGDCLACYVADITCARTNCLLSCGLMPTSQACADCRDLHGCVSAFYNCSGLPLPTGSGSGGSGSGGSSNAGAGG